MYASQAAATGAVVTVLVTLIGLLALFFIVRAAVTEGMKSYQKWREATGRDIPPADVAAPPAQP